MSGGNGRDLQGVFGALLGGLISGLVGTILALVLLDSDGSTAPGSMLVAVLVGLGCAIGFMVAGLLVPERFRWLGTALLFASGFTTIWSTVMSFGVEPRWVVPATLGVAVLIGLVIGWRRFAPQSAAETRVAPEDDAAWMR